MSRGDKQDFAGLIKKDANNASIVIDRLKRAIKAKTSIKALSERIGVPYRTLQSYFSGAHMMPLDTFAKICLELQLDSNWLIRGGVRIEALALREALKTAGHPIQGTDIVEKVDNLFKLVWLIDAYSAIIEEEGMSKFSSYIKNNDSKLKKIEELISKFMGASSEEDTKAFHGWTDEEFEIFYLKADEAE